MAELPRSLALVAARLNDDARTALIDLLGGQLQEQVADLVRRIDLETAEVDAYQQQLLAGFAPPREGGRKRWMKTGKAATTTVMLPVWSPSWPSASVKKANCSPKHRARVMRDE